MLNEVFSSSMIQTWWILDSWKVAGLAFVAAPATPAVLNRAAARQPVVIMASHRSRRIVYPLGS